MVLKLIEHSQMNFYLYILSHKFLKTETAFHLINLIILYILLDISQRANPPC